MSKTKTPISIDDILDVTEQEFLNKHPDRIGDPNSPVAKYKLITKRPKTCAYRVSSLLGRFTTHPLFILSMLVNLLVWLLVNSEWFADPIVSRYPAIGGWFLWDPAPYGILTLILSLAGSILASILLISDKKNEEKDRDKLDLDLSLALKNEIRYGFIDEKLQQILDKLGDNKEIEIEETNID